MAYILSQFLQPFGVVFMNQPLVSGGILSSKTELYPTDLK